MFNNTLESRVESLEKQLKLLQESASKETELRSGPEEIRNPDDASGARIEVFRFAQYLNDDKRILSILQRSASKETEFRSGPAEIRTQDPRRVKAMS